MRSLFMRSLIMSLLVLHLLLPGAYSEGDDRKPQRALLCKNPKAKEGQSTWQGCSTATCKRIGKQALWQPCPKVGLEHTVKENDEKIERNHEMSLEILKILGNCCPTTTTWDPASTTLIIKVDGKWSPWGTWASCDSSSGTKKRMRQCDSPSPKNGGESCAGSSQESENCPVDGGWNNWGNWGSCDSNTGTKKRYRQCYNPSPKNGGAYCTGNSQESTTETCPGIQLVPYYVTQSTTHLSPNHAHAIGAAKFCSDFNLNTYCHTAHGEEAPWIALVFREPVSVEKVELINGDNAQRLRNVVVRIAGTLPSNGKYVFYGGSVLGSFSGTATTDQVVTMEGTPIQGNYVVVQMKNNQPLHFREIRVFGHK